MTVKNRLGGPNITFAYDALGRRIRKIDSVVDETTIYYYNNNWQVLTEAEPNGTTKRIFVWGNYIDEPLLMRNLNDTDPDIVDLDFYYVHDALYNCRALVDEDGVIVERTTYDVYGNALTRFITDATGDGKHNIDDWPAYRDSFGKPECDADYNWLADYTNDGSVNTDDWAVYLRFDGKSIPAGYNSFFKNPYYFTSRRLDILDSGSLKNYHYRHRDYTAYMGRMMQHDPLGINPAGGKLNPLDILGQYTDGMSLYEYVMSNPVVNVDPNGLSTATSLVVELRKICKSYGCKEPHKCFDEATILATNYWSQFTLWAAANPGYQVCNTIATAIMGMGLDSGSTWFKLIHMQNFDPTDVPWLATMGGHQYVGVFHRCNTTLVHCFS